MQTRLCLSAHDELFLVDLDKVLYFQADDHYTNVAYASGSRFMLPFGLARIEERILAAAPHDRRLIRLGRKFIVNLSYVFRVNTARELLYLSTDQGDTVSIHISKPVLRSLLDMMREAETDASDAR